jgi:hypothetical protein
MESGFDEIPSGNGEAQVAPDQGGDQAEVEVEAGAGEVSAETESGFDAEAPLEEPQVEVEEEQVPTEDEEVKAEGEDQPAEQAKPVKKNGAQERIRALAAEKKAALERAQQVEAYYAQREAQLQQQWAAQLQAQQAAVEKQMAFYEQQAKAQAEREEQERFARLSPEEQVKQRFYKEAAEMAKQQLLPEVEAIRQENAQLRDTLQNWQQTAQKKRAVGQLMQRATEANTKVFSQTIGEQATGELAPILQELNLTYHSAFNEDPETAAAKLHEAFEKYHKAKLQAIATGKTGKKVQANKAAPKALPGGRAAVKGEINWPTREQLNADARFKGQGYEKWIAAGMPPLKGRPSVR